MKHPSKVRRLTLSIMGLFVTKKRNTTFLNHKDEYHNHYWFNEKLCDGVEIIAAVERISKKDAAELLMKAGISSYMGDKISEYIHNEHVAREQSESLKISRFMMILKRYAREQGMDISKFI
jgi:hypothetical protein